MIFPARNLHLVWISQLAMFDDTGNPGDILYTVRFDPKDGQSWLQRLHEALEALQLSELVEDEDAAGGARSEHGQLDPVFSCFSWVK